MKSEIIVNQKILEVLSDIKSLENMDDEFTKEAEYHCRELRKILVNKLVKYEYYIESKKRKQKIRQLNQKFAISENH